MIRSWQTAQPVDGPQMTWRTYTSTRACVYALEGSYASTCASAEVRAIERIIAGLEDLLKPIDCQSIYPIEIYLVDRLLNAVGDTPRIDVVMADSSAARERPIIRSIGPDTPSEPLPWLVTRHVLPLWFGPQVAAAPLFLDGIAGMIAARVGSGPTVAAVDEHIRAELAAGRPVSIFQPREDASTPGFADSLDAAAATSFLAFLIRSFSSSAIHTFLMSYDTGRRDQAALAAFHRPIASLEESWLTTLRRRPIRGTAFRSLFAYLIPMIRPYWRRELEVLLYMVLGLSYGLMTPLATKFLVDTIIPQGRLDLLVWLSLGMLTLYLLNSMISMRRAYVTSWINQNILVSLQQRIFSRLQWLPHSFYGRAKVGDLVARLTSDVTLIQQAMSQVAGVGVFLALRSISAAVALMVLSPLLGGLILLVVPIFTASYLLLRSRFQQLSADQQRLNGESTAVAQENLTAHAVIKAFSLESRAIATYQARLMTQFKAALRLSVTGALFETSIALAITLGELLVLGVGGYMVIQGSLSMGTLLAFIGLLPSLFLPIAVLSGVGRSVEMATGALDRSNELLEEPISIVDQPDAIAAPLLVRAIRFEDVSFGYDSGRPILNGLNLTVPAGTHVAIVGLSGSGKSTLVNLLLRFWDPDSGRILLDDHDVRKVTLASLREQIGIVFQDTFVFDTTLRENIAIGCPGATDAEIEVATRAARLDSYVETLPARYDTMLGQHGVRMSGGQRQRLAIARALLRNPRILIFDEATSALDSQTEREVLETLAMVARQRTTISITHRLALAASADQIIVLDRGRVVEEGPHAELVEAGGLYQHLYEEQVGPGHNSRPVSDGAELARLKTIPLFAGLNESALRLLAAQLVRERYPANVEIVHEGDSGDRLYLIRSGQVEVVVGGTLAERRLNTLGEHDYFGEMALLEGAQRTATVRTLAPTELFSLARTDFTALLEREPLVRQMVVDGVAARKAAISAILTPDDMSAART